MDKGGRSQHAFTCAARAPLKIVKDDLKQDEVLLEYVLDDPNSYCVSISEKGAFVRALPTGREFGSSYVLENTRMSTADRCSEGLVRDDVDYNEDAYLLYKLAREIVKHLEAYLPNEDDVRNVLQYHQTPLVNIIHSQMQGHDEEKVGEVRSACHEGVHNAAARQLFNPGG
jgi:hypothetical protein